MVQTELMLIRVGCTYRWFSTPEVCMILERFNTIVFVGDEIAQSIYTAFNILLREDLALGGLQQWIMIDQDRKNCKCDNQFLNVDCFGYAIKNRDEVKKNEIDGDRKGSPYFCDSTPWPFNSRYSCTANSLQECPMPTCELKAYLLQILLKQLSKTSLT